MIIDQPGIFSRGHTLKPGELLRQARDLLATNPTSELTREFRAELLGIVESAPTTESLGIIDYASLASEHAEFIGSHNSLQIAQWLGEKLGIENWKNGEFHGENKILSTPAWTGIDRLQNFVEAIGINWSKANGRSDNHPMYLLLDGYVQNALFGKENMKQVDEGLNTFDRDWKAMGVQYSVKHEYFQNKTGIFSKLDWTEQPGVRSENGVFGASDAFCVSGSLNAHDVYSLQFRDGETEVGLSNASSARLCFLA